MMAPSRTKTTTDHDEIRRWVEARGGYPAVVTEIDSEDDSALLRIGYPSYSGEEKLRRISWEEFFERLDRNNLAFFYKEDSEQSGDSEEELIVEGKA